MEEHKLIIGPIRIGAETLESVPYVMHNSDNDDEGK